MNPEQRARCVARLVDEMNTSADLAGGFVDVLPTLVVAEPALDKVALIERLTDRLGLPRVVAAAWLNIVMDVVAAEVGSDAFPVFRAALGGVGPAAPATTSTQALAEIAATWDRIARWLRERRANAQWIRPAAPEALQALMETYQEDVPAQWLASLARHDGPLPGIFGDVTLYTLEQAEEALADDEAFGDLGWPIGQSPHGAVYIDPLGQVVEAAEPHGKPRVLGISFVAWLRARADALEAGRVLWHPVFERPVVAEGFPDLDALAAAAGDLRGVTAALFDALLAGRDAALPGFGAFLVELRSPSRGNERRNTLGFTPEAALTGALNGGPAPAPVASLPGWAKEVLSPAALAAIVGVLREGLAKGRVIGWRDVGEFSVAHRGKVALEDALDGTPMAIPARTSVLFRPYPAARARLNP